LVQRLVPLAPEIAADIVATAAIAGHRRTLVPALAHLSGLSVRVLEAHLRKAWIVPAEDLLGLTVSLHALWRRDVLRWTSKHAADAAGFSSPDAWSSYVARHVGARPATLVRTGGFGALLDRCARDMFLPHPPAEA
jgi:hypothetical protein